MLITKVFSEEMLLGSREEAKKAKENDRFDTSKSIHSALDEAYKRFRTRGNHIILHLESENVFKNTILKIGGTGSGEDIFIEIKTELNSGHY